MENWTPRQLEDFKDLSNLVNERRNDYQRCSGVLKKEVEMSSRRGTYSKIILIILGALVATKGIVDQLMVDYKSNKLVNNSVLICFTLIGLAISIIAGFETAFKYSEKAAGLRILSAEVQANLRKGVTNQAFNFYTQDFQEAMNDLKNTISELNDKLGEIYDKATSFGLDLASKTN